MRFFLRITYFIFGGLVLFWPMTFFISAFVFDSPNIGFFKSILLWYATLSSIGYPAYVIAAFAFSQSLLENKNMLACFASSLIPLLSVFPYAVIYFAIYT